MKSGAARSATAPPKLFTSSNDDPDGLAQSGGLLGLLQRHVIDHGLIEAEGVVLGRDVLGHQDKAPETLYLGLVAVFALVALGGRTGADIAGSRQAGEP